MAEVGSETPVNEAYVAIYTFRGPSEQSRNAPGTRPEQAWNPGIDIKGTKESLR